MCHLSQDVGQTQNSVDGAHQDKVGPKHGPRCPEIKTNNKTALAPEFCLVLVYE